MALKQEPEPPWALDAWTLQVMMAADNVEQRQDVRQLPLRLQEEAVEKERVALAKEQKKKEAVLTTLLCIPRRVLSRQVRNGRHCKRERARTRVHLCRKWATIYRNGRLL